MELDLTKRELYFIKSDVSDFIDKISNLSKEFQFDFKSEDKAFFSIIAKHVIFFKYLLLVNNDCQLCRGLIYDLFSISIAIIKNEVRYIYLNERSIVENYLRLILHRYIKDNRITRETFATLNKTQFRCSFTQDEFSLIKGEYSVASSYIHGNFDSQASLTAVFDNFLNDSLVKFNKSKFYNRTIKLLKLLDRLLLSEHYMFISDSFHRKKTILAYLFGKDFEDLLFQLLETPQQPTKGL